LIEIAPIPQGPVVTVVGNLPLDPVLSLLILAMNARMAWIGRL
jgi:hypothetical protein